MQLNSASATNITLEQLPRCIACCSVLLDLTRCFLLIAVAVPISVPISASVDHVPGVVALYSASLRLAFSIHTALSILADFMLGEAAGGGRTHREGAPCEHSLRAKGFVRLVRRATSEELGGRTEPLWIWFLHGCVEFP